MKNFFSFLSKFNHKKIICFDGGGVRTKASIVFLKKLEAESGKKVSDILTFFCILFNPGVSKNINWL